MSPSLGVTHHLLPPLRLWLFHLRNHYLGVLPCCVTSGKLLNLSESQEPLESREMSRVWEARRRQQGSNNDPGVRAPVAASAGLPDLSCPSQLGLHPGQQVLSTLSMSLPRLKLSNGSRGQDTL